MVKTYNDFTICENRADVEGEKWSVSKKPIDQFWDGYRFNLTSIILCIQDSSVWIAGIDGTFKEL